MSDSIGSPRDENAGSKDSRDLATALQLANNSGNAGNPLTNPSGSGQNSGQKTEREIQLEDV